MRRRLGTTLALTIAALLITLVGCDAKFGGFVGKPWPPIGALPALPNGPSEEVFQHPNAVVAGAANGDSLWVADSVGVFHSADGGRNWRHVRRGSFVGLVVSDDQSRVIALASDGFLHRSSDQGKRWQKRDLSRELKALQADEWEYRFSAHELWASEDTTQLIVVANCGGFVSKDSGSSWSLLPGGAQWNDEDHCLAGLTVNASFEPVRAAVDITGTLAAGNYIFERRGQLWVKRCSFDLVGYLLESVQRCDELAEFADDYVLRKHSDDMGFELILDIDPDEAIFRNAHLPITNLARARQWSNLLVDDVQERLWWISYSGVARSDTMGESWQTTAGGIALREAPLRFNGLDVGLYEGGIYARRLGVWEAIAMPERVYQLLITPAGLLSLGEKGIWLLPALTQTAKRVDDNRNFESLSGSGSLVWGLGDTLAASTDGGRNWQHAEREVEGLDWLCARQCLRVDWEGGVWRARIETDVLVVGQDTHIALPNNHSVGDQWIASGAFWLVASRDDDADEDSVDHYHASFNLGDDWQSLALDSDIDEFVGLGEGRALAMTYDERIIGFDAALPALFRESLRLPGTGYGLCVREDGAVLVTVEGDHPDYPDAYDHLLYTTDAGGTWFTHPPGDGPEGCI